MIALMSVDLPAPFSPMSECTSPGNMRKSTPSIAASAPKRTVAPVSSQQRRGVVHQAIIACGCARDRRAGVVRPSLSGVDPSERDDHALHDDEEQQQDADDDAASTTARRP